MRGSLDAALNAYQDSLAITEKLAAQDSNNAEWQGDLSTSFVNIGDVQSARGNLDAALKAYQDGLDIREKLAAQDTSNAEWQRDLIVSNVKLAEVAEEASGSAAARRHYQAALAIAGVLRDAGRLAPVDAWVVEDLKARLKPVSAQAAR
jgi:tetratricopeptide (TPR) repeat protein